MESYKGKWEKRKYAIGMRITKLCYAGYLTGSSKKDFEQKFLTFVLKGLDVGDINHSSEIYSK